MISDRLDTDILMANLAEVDSLLVRTGWHNESDVERMRVGDEEFGLNPIEPTFMLDSLGTLGEA